MILQMLRNPETVEVDPNIRLEKWKEGDVPVGVVGMSLRGLISMMNRQRELLLAKKSEALSNLGTMTLDSVNTLMKRVKEDEGRLDLLYKIFKQELEEEVRGSENQSGALVVVEGWQVVFRPDPKPKDMILDLLKELPEELREMIAQGGIGCNDPNCEKCKRLREMIRGTGAPAPEEPAASDVAPEASEAQEA